MTNPALIALPSRLPFEESNYESRFENLSKYFKKIYIVKSSATVSKNGILEQGLNQASTSIFEFFPMHTKLENGGAQKLLLKALLKSNHDVIFVKTGESTLSSSLTEKALNQIIRKETDIILISPESKANSALGLVSRISSRFNNFFSGASLTNWHAPICVYSRSAIESTNFLQGPNGQGFNADLLLQFKSAGLQILEIRDKNVTANKVKISHAIASFSAVLKHRLKFMGFTSSYVLKPSYRFKFNTYSSHGQISTILKNLPRGKMLDLGCADGQLSEIASSYGHDVIAVDIVTPKNLTPKVKFIQHNLEIGLPYLASEKFNFVLCADILEHLRAPDILLSNILSILTDDGTVLVSIPNFSHWYPRIRVLLGRFDYDARGILDQSHLRFFSRRSFLKISSLAGFDASQVSVTGTPFEVMLRGAPQRRFKWDFLLSILSKCDRVLCKIRPNLFAYQFIFELKPKAGISS